MPSNKLSEWSNEELVKNTKSLRVISYLLAATLLLLIILNLIRMLKQGFSAIDIIPVALMPILILNFVTLKKYKDEIKLRGNLSVTSDR